VSHKKSILVVGFNTRPLAFSLDKAGYDVYAVDFFGDLDFYPHVKDCMIITKELGTSYDLIKENYAQFLVEFSLKLLDKNRDIDFLLIGSGLDNSFEQREKILNHAKKLNPQMISLNNTVPTVKDARDIDKIYEMVQKKGYRIPISIPLNDFAENPSKLQYPLILKKKLSSGGVNVFKILNQGDLEFHLELIKKKKGNLNQWIVQEYIEGIPVSCTTISNGVETQIISINRQILGEKLLNAPQPFIYCGNISPSNLLKEHLKLIPEIALFLSHSLKLKGINGFDFVLKKKYPYLMEINPRIPGSVRVSEEAYQLNLLKLHIQSFDEKKWISVKENLQNLEHKGFATKFVYFAPKKIEPTTLEKINSLAFIHDNTPPTKPLFEGEPVCTILFKEKTFAGSYFGALNIAEMLNTLLTDKS